MFRNMTEEGHLSSGPSPSHSAGLGVASHGYVSQESSWIGLLSVLSRPALSFIHKHLPGRSVLFGREAQMNFVSEQSTFLNPLDDTDPAAGAKRCDGDGLLDLREPTGGAGLPWGPGLEHSHVALHQQTQTGYLTTARILLGQILLSSVSGERRLRTVERQRRNWWNRFWSTGDGSLSSPEMLFETKSPVSVFVRQGDGASTPGEHAGLCDHKDKPANKGHLQTEQHPSTRNHLRRSGGVTPCSEVTLTTPDQDNGYSSLEEEHLLVSQMYSLTTQSEEVQLREQSSAMQAGTDGQDESTAETDEAAGGPEDGEDEEEERAVVTQSPSAAAELTNIQCSNKAISFIMGCPCSDDEDNQSESSSDDDEDDDDDDGFDSECSSELSDLSGDDDDDEASDSDSETDVDLFHMWTSYQSHDPYNPQNFTACIRTCSTTPLKPNPTATSSVESTPTSSLDVVDVSPASSSSLPEYPEAVSLSSLPPESLDVWDDSTSASDTDEAESLRIWSSFSCTSDPYSPLNFQASIRTQEAAKVDEMTLEPPPRNHCYNATLPPQYRKEEADERMDSGFCETPSSTGGAAVVKKVRFCEEVEEFFTSCGEEEEDRRGPWEQLARDRCRFLRRCQEVEQSIAFCLQPQHRRRVLLRHSAAPAQGSLGRRASPSQTDAETDAAFSAR